MSVIDYLESDHNPNQPLSEDLHDKLREDILTGKLADREKLTEMNICNEYGISRTPVRDAIHQLEVEGLVETIPNRGAFVIGMTEQDIRDIFVLRAAGEIQAVRWAVQRITDDELDELDETFEFMEFYTMRNDIPKMININNAFHQIIYHATHNRLMIRQLSDYQAYIRNAVPSNYYASNYLRNVLSEHREIYEAIKSKDVEAGAQAMQNHMERSTIRKSK